MAGDGAEYKNGADSHPPRGRYAHCDDRPSQPPSGSAVAGRELVALGTDVDRDVPHDTNVNSDAGGLLVSIMVMYQQRQSKAATACT